MWLITSATTGLVDDVLCTRNVAYTEFTVNLLCVISVELFCLCCVLGVDIRKIHEEDDDRLSLLIHPAFLTGLSLLYFISFCFQCNLVLPSVLSFCWLGDRKCIEPVKTFAAICRS